MSFGIVNLPFGFSPLFNDLELFGEPRYVRRNFGHPRAHRLPPFGALAYPSWSPVAPSFRRRSASPTLFELFDLGEDVFEDWNEYFDVADHVNRRLIEDKSKKPKKESGEVVKSPSTVVASAAKPRLGYVTSRNTDNGVKFEVHLPGLAVEDVKLDLDTEKKHLKVTAEKKTEEKHEDASTGGVTTSVHHISISRILPLASVPNPESLKADFVDGVLSIDVNTKLIEGTAPESEAKTDVPATSSPSSTSTAPTVTSPAESASSSSTYGESFSSMDVTSAAPSNTTAPTTVPEVVVEDASD